ncbi:MAG: sulfatase-like hydrolase/transferase [Campylobacteraceae bacterium]|jgi:glucan phosphoethanolaminetransferase (alkaline phosphatase superfamily)|nr:sulfatase-like hydrolase/transferase [Campylobacteraceae bacterium]
MNYLKRFIFFNVSFAVLFVFFIVLIDFILEFFISAYDVSFDPLFLLILFAAGLFLSFNKSQIFFYLFIFFIFSLQLVQISSIVYFGYYIQPSEIDKIFLEFSDIKDAALAEADSFLLIPISLIIPLAIIIAANFFLKKNSLKIPFAFVLVLLLFIPKIERATRRDIQFFFPSPVRYSFHNTINTFSFYAGKEIWVNNNFKMPQNFYLPYTVEKYQPKAQNIILVIGESVNPNHLSLFGYDRLTTPFLNMLKEDDRFDYQEAVSGGVSTHSSMAFFLNGVREPGNTQEIKSKTFNLFKLAKEQDFSTFFISAQDAKIAYEIGNKYIDEIVTKEEEFLLFKTKRDQGLLDVLDELALTDKNFIVIQMRTPHAPYEDNYDEGSEFDVFKDKSKRIDTYDNSVLYFDFVLKNIFNNVEKLIKNNGYFIFVSDHGQVFGENGFYGHNKLDMSVAAVPFLSYSVNGDKIPYKTPSQYEIAEWIGELLGYKFINPNLQNNTFYVHGNNFLSNYEFISYIKINGNIAKQSKTILNQFIQKSKEK